jgi:hypothetical protein
MFTCPNDKSLSIIFGKRVLYKYAAVRQRGEFTKTRRSFQGLIDRMILLKLIEICRHCRDV